MRLRLPAAFLQTRIARRVFGLFLLCAVLPTATLGAVGYWIVSRELEDQARAELAQAGKVWGVLLLARLHEADRSLVEVVEALHREAPSARSSAAPLVERFRSVGAGMPGRPARPLLGLAGEIPPPATTREALEHLHRDRPLLVVESAAGGPRIYLVRALDPSQPATLYVWGEISSRYLWDEEIRESLAADDIDFCANAAGLTQPLNCSSGEAEGRLHAAVASGGADVVGATSDVFLGFDFGAEPWTLRLSRPLSVLTAPAEFRRSVLLTLALGIWLVVLASNVLIRHRLDPVARLREATSRVAEGDFSATVTVSTNDELEDLGNSFNTMAGRLRDQFERLNAMSWGTLEALARSIDAVSPWTAGHSERVTKVGMAIGRQLGLPADQLDQLHRGGLLHDVGKIGVPSAILDKPGKLDDAEFAAIRAHPVIGARILEPIRAYDDVLPIVRHHHERFDGTGYPDRLAGENIPHLARVLSVADVYDALVSRRPYREGWTHEAAVAYIAERASIEFDPAVVAAFLALVAGPAWPLDLGDATVLPEPLLVAAE